MAPEETFARAQRGLPLQALGKVSSGVMRTLEPEPKEGVLFGLHGFLASPEGQQGFVETAPPPT